MTTPARQHLWQELFAHSQQIRTLHMRDLFLHETGRASRYSIEWSQLLIDYSKNIITDETLALLMSLARACELDSRILDMLGGDRINVSEDRAVLHTALRCPAGSVVMFAGENVIDDVQQQLHKIKTFVNAVHSGLFRGWTDKPLTTFVNIGIGGSDLGPKLAVDALKRYRQPNTQSFFISNLDYEQIQHVTSQIDPETTLFIVSSRSFGTLETRTNAESLLTWMQEAGCNAIDKHFIAISSNYDAATEFGIAGNNIFSIRDWVGGRFSLWSATGMPVALALGFQHFEKLLSGAHEMDRHFAEQDFEQNIPVILALLDVWYNNFFDADTHAFIPYDESLRLLPDFLSQLLMESNGKSTTRDNNVIDYHTIPISWGASGTNAQHTFFQLLHQGTRMVPIDFLAAMTKPGNQQHQDLLIANCIAQSQALMQGEESSSPHNYFPGNKPSNTLFYSELSPENLGKLLALYEHRTFVQGVLWNINSFDQWGVELGKRLATSVYEAMQNGNMADTFDSSTANLTNYYLNKRQP